ncbi:MAG TPA: Uma2 family endonuclease [Gemmatimonadaceae bacterium]
MPLPVPRFTIEMLDAFPDDGTRYELLEGILIVTPAPNQAHQVVATRLATMLSNALAPSGLARVVAVGALQRGKRTQLQPDVLVLPSAYPPTEEWAKMRGWWLAVEVLSRSSRVYDREVKRGAYLALGVEEYWVVDMRGCFVESWSREHPEGRRFRGALSWRPSALGEEVVLDLGELFRDVCEPGEE